MGDYDEDTAFLGQTGPYFWTTFFLLNTVFISTGFNGLYFVFVGAVPKHHCLVPESNLTEEWRTAIIPVTAVDGEAVQSQCSRYRLDVVINLSAEGLAPGRDVNLTDVSVFARYRSGVGVNVKPAFQQTRSVTIISVRQRSSVQGNRSVYGKVTGHFLFHGEWSKFAKTMVAVAAPF